MNQYLTDKENRFCKVSVTLVKYQFVLVIWVKYWFTDISTLMIFNRYVSDTNWYILDTNIIGKSG